MDIRQLRHFTTVAETLHFGKAAEKLGMTQPPLSQSILGLEREIGAPLFTRTKRSVALTPLGESWLPHVSAALREVAALPELAQRIKNGETGRLDLSFVSTADYSILPLLVHRYAARFPDVAIHLTEATSDVQIAQLLEGHGQAGLILPPPNSTLSPALAYRPLVTEELIAAIPESWIETGQLSIENGCVSPDTITQAPLVIFPRRTAPAYHDLVTGYYATHGRHAHIVQEAIQMQTIISLVSAGMGLTLVPASLRNLARTGVRYVPLAQGAPLLETGIVWRKGDNTPVLKQLLDMASALGSGLQDQDLRPSPHD